MLPLTELIKIVWNPPGYNNFKLRSSETALDHLYNGNVGIIIWKDHLSLMRRDGTKLEMKYDLADPSFDPQVVIDEIMRSK